jgi:hypothetical protein
MKRILRQVCRGCGDLPHVGEHPGTIIVVVLLTGGTIGAGWIGLAIISLIAIPGYLVGAYDRAETSDHLQRKGA